MTRGEADVMLQEYDDAGQEYRWDVRLNGGSGPAVDVAFVKMNALRERLIDRLCGEEATQPLAGNAP